MPAGQFPNNLITVGGSANIWTASLPLPTGRSGLAAEVMDGKLYVLGGSGGPTSVEMFDPATQSWSLKSPMPTARTTARSAVVDGKIYGFGGGSVEEYDPATDTWFLKGSMPTSREGFAVSVVNGIIYVMGGVYGSQVDGVISNEVNAYDPATSTWSTKVSMPTARTDLASGVISGKIYAIGGATDARSAVLCSLGGGTNCGFFNKVEEYNPTTNSWSAKAPMPTWRARSSVSPANGKLFVIGGNSGLRLTEAYDPATNTWFLKTPMPTARAGLASSILNGRVFTVGGNGGLNTVEVYDPLLEP
jgi:N-acetylneuraminic acid mutarotase